MGCVDILELDLIIGAKSQFTPASATPIMTTVLLICLSWVKYMEVTVLLVVSRGLRAVCRHKETRRERDGLEGLSQGGRVMKVQWAPWVIKRHGGYSEQVLTMCTQGCEKHSTSLAGYVCLSFCMFACVYVWPSRVVMRDGVRLRRLKLPAFLWVVSFIYLPCPHAFILKHILTDSVWQAQNHTQIHTPFVCVCLELMALHVGVSEDESHL